MTTISYHASPGLEAVEPLFKQGLDEALAEREALGIGVPDTFHAGLYYANGKGRNNAEASLAKKVTGETQKRIKLNVAKTIGRVVHPETTRDIIDVMRYFELVSDFLGHGEEVIIQTVQHPVKTLRKFEDSFEPGQLDEYKAVLAAKGTDYKTARSFTYKHAKLVRGLLQKIAAKAPEALAKTDFRRSLRHELDHVVMFGSPFYDTHNDLVIETLTTTQPESPGELKAHAEKTMLRLKQEAEVLPLIEARGHVFNYVVLGDLGETDYDEIAPKIFDDLIKNYRDGVFLERVLDTVVIQYRARNEMNQATSNYLHWSLLTQLKSPLATTYGNFEEGIDMELAKKIMYEEIPAWQKIFTDNARVAVRAVTTAFKEDPSRFVTADAQAQTFEEYVAICRGE